MSLPHPPRMPALVFANELGEIQDFPELDMAGRSGSWFFRPELTDLVRNNFVYHTLYEVIRHWRSHKDLYREEQARRSFSQCLSDFFWVAQRDHFPRAGE